MNKLHHNNMWTVVMYYDGPVLLSRINNKGTVTVAERVAPDLDVYEYGDTDVFEYTEYILSAYLTKYHGHHIAQGAYEDVEEVF